MSIAFRQHSRRAIHTIENGTLQGRVGPVSISEFEDSLGRTFNTCKEWGSMKLGLAVSGGVDSMSLAYLLGRLKTTYSGLRLHAFIVDHKLRSGSTDEANIVAKALERLLPNSTRPTVLPIDWPPGVNPSELRNFETQARRLRYRLLGEACRANGIRSLLLAHNADDIAETTLMRLANGHRTFGLAPMNRSAKIAECIGLHGVHMSGDYSECRDLCMDPYMSGFESGGVRIIRPLLDFPKSRLVETCKQNSVSWFEDETNHDPTLTQRNAARSLLRSSRLPKALQTSSLIEFSHRLARRAAHREQVAEKFFDACSIEMFDPRSSFMGVLLPDPLMVYGEGFRKWPKASKEAVLATALAKLVSPASPYGVVEKSSMITPARELAIARTEKSPLEIRRWQGTAGGVCFSSLHHKHIRIIDGFWEYSIYRQPVPRTQLAERLDLQSKENVLSFPPATGGKDSLKKAEFRLWDNRFWIRLVHHTKRDLFITNLSPAGLDELRRSLKPRSQKSRENSNADLENALSSLTPGGARWALPALFSTEPSSFSHGRWGRVIALPTLGITLPGWEHGGTNGLQWEIRYKDPEILATRLGTRTLERRQNQNPDDRTQTRRNTHSLPPLRSFPVLWKPSSLLDTRDFDHGARVLDQQLLADIGER